MDQQLKRDIAALHANLCNALANPHRILIICMLADENKNVSQLTAELEIPQSSVSRHLKVLVEKGLVYAKRRGQFVEYELADHRVISALQILREVVADMLKEQVAMAHIIEHNASNLFKEKES